MNIHHSDESNSEIQALSDIPLHDTPIYHHVILKLEWHMTLTTISDELSINTAPVPWVIKGYLFMKCSILPAFKILSDIK
jgi:hypothetical protein